MPHFQPLGYTYFVTFRLANSLPAHVVSELMDEHETEIKKMAVIDNKKEKAEKYSEAQLNYFEKFDSLLDKYNSSENWLKRNEIAKVVFDAIMFYDKKKYDLIAFTVMPNHVHVVFKPIDKPEVVETEFRPTIVGRNSVSSFASDGENIEESNSSTYIVTKILQDLKKYTARECNKLLGRAGAFWQHESYDHVVRNEDELQRIVEYVLNNPAKAGLCDANENWKWNYFNPENY